jgi:hypothetical protein
MCQSQEVIEAIKGIKCDIYGGGIQIRFIGELKNTSIYSVGQLIYSMKNGLLCLPKFHVAEDYDQVLRYGSTLTRIYFTSRETRISCIRVLHIDFKDESNKYYEIAINHDENGHAVGYTETAKTGLTDLEVYNISK